MSQAVATGDDLMEFATAVNQTYAKKGEAVDSLTQEQKDTLLYILRNGAE